jgi:hypothetical protein
MKINTLVSAFLSLASLMFDLLVLWLTLGWKVRKARKAFEKQLIKQGMKKGDAKRLSAQYSKLRNDVMSALKGSLFRYRPRG